MVNFATTYPLSDAHREIMWNIAPNHEPVVLVMYGMFLVALGFFGYGLYRHISSWRKGRADGERVGDWAKRAWIVIRELAFQGRVRRSRIPAIFHSLIYYSFIVLVFTTAVVALDYDFGTNFFQGYFYVLLTVGAEAAGVLILVGIGMAVWRRLVVQPDTLETKSRIDMWPLWLVAVIVITGYLIEGLRIAAIGDPWAYLSPVGWAVAGALGWMSTEAATTSHKVMWWLHTVLAFVWIGSIPYTKFMHLISLPTNVFFSRFKPRGEWARVNVMEMMEDEDFDEENFTLGINKADEFTWKQRLDFDACINCGRCDEVCPSRRIDDPFGPKQFIKGCLEFVEKIDAQKKKLDDEGNGEEPTVVGTAFEDDFVWFCRMCGACMEVCPACIDHVDTFAEIRRHLIMMLGSAPQEALQAMKLYQNKGNPFASQSERKEWIDSLDVRVVKPGEKVDVLVFIGCCTTFDPVKHRIATDLFNLLERCGIDFGILGNDERCCGDPARLMGHEEAFQAGAAEQLELLQSREFNTLLTGCPHCYNVFKNEYPQLFGTEFNVMHHSQFLQKLLADKALTPSVEQSRRVVFHDPCFLGRYQGIYDSPRDVLKALPGLDNVEMVDSRETSLCCGGGGGHYWMDLEAKERINNLRVDQAQKQGVDTIATGCAYCKQMLDDALKAKDLEDNVKTMDLSSLLLASLPKDEDAPADTKEQS